MGFEQFLAGHRRQNLQLLRGVLPNETDALARDPTKKLIFQFACQKFPGRLSLRFGHLGCSIVDQDGKWYFRLTKVPKKGTSFFEILGKVVDIDHRHSEFRLKNRNFACAFVLCDKLLYRLGIKRIERTFRRRFVIQRPELFRDVPGHNEITPSNFWTHPVRGNGDGVGTLD